MVGKWARGRRGRVKLLREEKRGKRLTEEVAAPAPRAHSRRQWRQDLRSGALDGERRRGRGVWGGGSRSARVQVKDEGVRSAWRAHERGSRLAAVRTRRRRAAVGRCARVEAGEREAPTSGLAWRVGPSHREREEGREGGTWAQFSNLIQI
jgi:hypothetical protein